MKVMMSNDKYADIFRKAVKATWRFGCEGSLALNLCDIADGQYDTIIVPDTVGGPWDFAAGVVILREAGGYAGDWERNKFDINKPTPFLGASSKHIYNLVQKTFFGGDKQ
jgi:fructose-1,6-bisphosphatase/inositol monophosphatase family enzyme